MFIDNSKCSREFFSVEDLMLNFTYKRRSLQKENDSFINVRNKREKLDMICLSFCKFEKYFLAFFSSVFGIFQVLNTK